MSASDSFDRESFQSLLANSFSVQQSGMAPQSLAAIIEIQRTISNDDLDADSAMNLIADSARAVANASGIGIALLEGTQLVHCAGTGSASKLLGSQLAAVLSASVHNHPRREILRVEDAQADSRVEAEICRQFDAQALLMVPIYRDSIMIGVLEILFSEPHAFEEPEVRTYQLMATLAGDASVLPARVSEKAGIPPSTVPHALWKMTSVRQELGVAGEPVQRSTPHLNLMYAKLSIAARVRAIGSRLSELRIRAIRRLDRVSLPMMPWPRISMPPFRWPSTTFHTNWRSALERIPLPRRPRQMRWYVAGMAVVVVVVIVGSITRHQDRIERVTDASPATPPVSTIPSPNPQPLPATSAAKPQAATFRRDVNAPNSSFKRMPVGRNEVDYVADDVTIRHFHSVSPSIESRRGNRQVKIGEDVTVRYFNSPHTLPQAKPASATEQSLRD